jgi:alpha-N-acetylglucosaminidase
MTPITPSFAGFVPEALKKVRSDVSITKSSGWCGFQPTYLIRPDDPIFIEIGKKFIDEYRKEYGTNHLYLADTFNEMSPQVSKDNKLADLAAQGEAIYRSIISGDPDGVWVMQGWLFLDTGFWGNAETKAFLSRVPDDRMIIIDLADDRVQVWRQQEAVRKKKWIHCLLHNFGQNTKTFGSLNWCVDVPFAALHDENHGQMVGMGLSPEGIEQNSVLYELMTDMMWQNQPVDLKKWLHDYAVQRYGACPLGMDQAWAILSETIYARPFAEQEAFALRPVPCATAQSPVEPAKVREAIKLFLACSDKLGTSDLYRRDLVDMLKQYLSDGANSLLDNMNRAFESGKLEELEKWSDEYLAVLEDFDRLVATRPEYRLTQWIADARRWGTSKRESDQLEWNARMQVTVWGGPALHDYACKGWTGLLTDFYIPRWRLFIDKLKQQKPGEPFDPKWNSFVANWEESWCKQTDPPKELKSGDAIAVSRELFAKYTDWPDRWIIKKDDDPGIAVGKPTTASSFEHQYHPPSAATDGDSINRDANWSASPASQWLQIDLEKPVKIDRIHIFTYWDWVRCYQYTVEASLDGKNWFQIIDMSKNTRIATSLGSLHSFTPIDARYVRVNMLANSVNKGMHLVEVRVFATR